jgi:hypothetical protein
MKTNFYLVVNSNGTVQAKKMRPKLAQNEISMYIDLVLPQGLFTKPQLSAQLTIPDSAAMPPEITAEVQENVREAIEQASGMHVKLTLEVPPNADQD